MLMLTVRRMATLMSLLLALAGCGSGGTATPTITLPPTIYDAPPTGNLTLTTAAQATATPTVTATPEPSATPRPTDPPPPPIPVPEWEYGLDACALAGSETAEVIFGEMASEPSSSFVVDYNDPAYTFTCTYQTDRYAAYLYIWIARTVESATARYDLYREAAGPEAIDPGGAGDAAFWWPDALEVRARQANALVWVSLDHPHQEVARAGHALVAAALNGLAESATTDLAPTPAAEVDPGEITVGDVTILDPPDWNAIEGGLCALLDEEEVEAIIGDLTTAAMQPQTAIGEDVGQVFWCSAESQGGLLSLAVDILPSSPAGAHHRFVDGLAAARDSGEVVFVEGVGNRAYQFVGADGISWRVAVVEGNILLNVDVQAFDLEITQEQLVGLAQAALERLIAGNY